MLNGTKYFLQEYFKIIQYLYQLKSTLNILVALLGMICGNLNGMSDENIEKITKANSNFPSTFVDHHLLPDTYFNGHYLKLIFLCLTK